MKNLNRALLGALLFALSSVGAERTAPGGDFTLRGKAGSVSLSDFRGRVVVLYFGYVTCPDVCPNALSLIRSAFQRLHARDAERVVGVFITLDPERDTATIASDYASQFDRRIIGLSGSPAQIRDVAARYGVKYTRVPIASAMGYSVDHTSSTYVIDARGKLSRVIGHGTTAGVILAVLEETMRREPRETR